MITIAAAKGYLLDDALARFSAAGIEFEPGFSGSRKLDTINSSAGIRLLQIRPWDVPVYVEKGAADLGIVGYDVLMEKSPDCLQLLDLKFGECKLVIAGAQKIHTDAFPHYVTVATKYPNSAQQYFRDRQIKADIVKLYGAVELAPSTGLATLICDLTATGTTLQENNLHIIDTIFTSTARLIANRSSMRFSGARICTLADQFRQFE